jgi:HAD superfamily hydrolase (TIGR01484 family)
MSTDFSQIRCLFADIDDTISTDGKITREAYSALWDAYEQGLAVVPVTGRPAGWCDHIARMWPVTGVIGENGGLYFRMDGGRMERVFLYSDEEREEFRSRLEAVKTDILEKVPGAGIASDQSYREYDLAIDFCEDVPALPREDIDRIVEIFTAHGATAKVSSIHVNGWFGDFDKLTMAKRFARDVFGLSLDENNGRFAFCGDSPNDEPMFAFFDHSFGVANVRNFLDQLTHPPAHIMSKPGGGGFTQVVEQILQPRDASSSL